MRWEKNVWKSIELKEFAKKLKSIQPYLDKWGVTDVDLLSNTIGLYNPALSYKKRNIRKRMLPEERRFFRDIAHYSVTYPTVVPDIIEHYSDIFVDGDPICFALSGAEYEINKVRELLWLGKEGGFAICRNGAVTDIVEGEEDRLHTGKYFEEFCRARNSEVWIDVHGHPSGVKMPTIADMTNVAQEGGEWSCVVTKEREIVCAKPIGEAEEKAKRLRGVECQDEKFSDLYNEYARELSSYGSRWRSFDIVDKNIDVVRCEV